MTQQQPEDLRVVVTADATGFSEAMDRAVAQSSTLQRISEIADRYRAELSEEERQIADLTEALMVELMVTGSVRMPNGQILIHSGGEFYAYNPGSWPDPSRHITPTRDDSEQQGQFRVSRSTGGLVFEMGPSRSLVDDEGRYAGIDVRLDECWKCQTPVPKDDDVGLCEPCKTAMREFTDTPTPVAPVYDQEWGNDLGALPTDEVRPLGASISMRWEEELAEVGSDWQEFVIRSEENRG